MAKDNPDGFRSNRIRYSFNVSGVIATLIFAAIVWYLASMVKYLNTGSTKHLLIFSGVATFTVLTLIIMARFNKPMIVTKTEFIFHNVYHDIIIPLSAIKQVYRASIPRQEDYFRYHGLFSLLFSQAVRLVSGKSFPSYTSEEIREKFEKSPPVYWLDVSAGKDMRSYMLLANQITVNDVPTKGSYDRMRAVIRQLVAELPPKKIDSSVEINKPDDQLMA